MGRHKQYCRNEVLNSAMLLFWKHGYTATSLIQLCKVTGLNKKSLYLEFESKSALFTEVMAHYTLAMNGVENALNKEPFSPQNVFDFLDFISGSSTKLANGCLLTIALNESSQLDKPHIEFIGSHFKKIENLFYQNLASCLEKKEAKRLSKYLLVNMLGLTSWLKLKPNEQSFHDVMTSLALPIHTALNARS